MDGRLVSPHHRLWCNRFATCLTTGTHHAGVSRWLTPKGLPILLSMHAASPLPSALLHGRQCSQGSCLWPGIRQRGSTCQPGCITSIERAFPLVLWFLAGSTCSLTPGTGARVSETLSRRSPPLPAQTGSLGTTCEGQPPEALCRCMGAPLHHLWKRPGGFLAIGEGQRLCCRGPRGGSAAAGCRLETRRPLGFPWPDPCRDGGTINLRERGDVLDRPPCRTAQQTLGARGREGMSHGSSYGRGAHVGCLSADVQSVRWGPSPGGVASETKVWITSYTGRYYAKKLLVRHLCVI